MVRRKDLNLLILLVAAAARIVVFILAAGGFFLVGEGEVQANLAENIVSGRGFMVSGSLLHSSDPRRHEALEFYRSTGALYGGLIPDRPTSFMMPGYALFAALIFTVTSTGDLLAVVGVQLALGVLTVYLGLRLASRFLDGGWYAAAGLFMALDPFELYYQAIPVTQALFSLCFAAGLLLSLRFLERPSAVSGSVAGLVWGLTFMVRPAALPMVLWLGAVFLFSRRPSLRSFLLTGMVLLAFTAAVVPWVLRNRMTMGRYQLLPVQGGVQMWEYNGRIFTDHFEDELAGADMLYGPVRETWEGRIRRPELAEFPSFTRETEFQRDSVLHHRQMEFLSANPGLFLHLMSCRFTEFFKPFPLNSFSPMHTLVGLFSFAWVGLFFMAGTLRLLRRGAEGFFVSGVIGGYILMHLLTASGTPHRVALDVLLFIAALTGLRYTLKRAGVKGV